MFKRGYENGEKIIEIVEGNLDVVLYSEKANGTFYFYRFEPENVIGKKFGNTVNIVSQNNMKALLAECGIMDYNGFIMQLVRQAVAEGMTARYEM
jgi:hypothetical protein